MTNYLDYFGLKAEPFTTTPDPRFTFPSREHELALTKIAYYIENRRGIFLLTGEIGTGKTTISQLALQGWKSQPDRFAVSHITDPSPRTPAAFLRLVTASFGLPYMRNLLDIKAAIRAFLIDRYKEGKTVVLVIDEAQTIYPTNLDTVQALVNEQTQTAKLVQVLLLAQPNFENKLTQKPALRSRIAGGTTLNPLTFEDAIELVRHRMDVAGGDFDKVFQPSTHQMLYDETKGIPRDLCVLCDSAMLNASALKRPVVDEVTVKTALKDLTFKQWDKRKAA